MNLSSKLALLKKRKPKETKPPPKKTGRIGRPRWAVVALGLLLAGGATLAVFEFFIWNKVPPALVGKWEVQGGPMSGGTFQFSRSGAVEVRHQGAQVALSGRATVDGETLLLTTRDPKDIRLEQTRPSTIRELTATTFVLELEKGEVLKMVRKE
jgi:hypothetical protein